MVTYPNGYGTSRVSLARMREIHSPRMHPEFARRLFAWIESRNGVIGIGGGWRTTPSNTSEASRNGQSFHQYQNFSGGPRSYAAVDLVATNPSGGNHRAVRWDEVPRRDSTDPDIQRFGVWCNTNNAHHMQPVPLHGWGSWNSSGRPNLTPWPMTGPPPPTPPQPPLPNGDSDMIIIDLNPGTDWWVSMMLAGDELTHLVNGHHVAVMQRGSVQRVTLGTPTTGGEVELDGILRSVSTTNDSPFAPGSVSFNQALHDAWVAARRR